MRKERKDGSGLVDYIPPYERGEILRFPDNDNVWELINVGDTEEIEAANGFSLGGSTVKIPRFTQFRQVELDKVLPGTSYSPEEMNIRLSLRGWLHTIELGGYNKYVWAPEKGWNDPRNS